MEPAVVGSVVGRVAAAFVTRSAVPVTGGAAVLPWWEEFDERGGLLLEDSAGETTALLTRDQVTQVPQFVCTGQRPLLISAENLSQPGMGYRRPKAPGPNR